MPELELTMFRTGVALVGGYAVGFFYSIFSMGRRRPAIFSREHMTMTMEVGGVRVGRRGHWVVMTWPSLSVLFVFSFFSLFCKKRRKKIR